ncbi:MAG: hypothetical protein COV44_09045 [Deltaproteobacteria bacterium CG11_big_fil_rev_8_21_14_0_20_45_16]|nr:MAG: hypothetical protein COV44_09045 [Deltaproteobacteria bacterium CG11_big_fil_rev_8_21_14_0_20_45_16]
MLLSKFLIVVLAFFLVACSLHKAEMAKSEKDRVSEMVQDLEKMEQSQLFPEVDSSPRGL